MSTGNNSAKQYMIGQNPTATCLFTNASNTPTDPTTVTFITVDPAGTQVNYATPNANILHVGTGIYEFIYPGTTGIRTPGIWAWRVFGTGALIDADEGTWEVLASTVPTP